MNRQTSALLYIFGLLALSTHAALARDDGLFATTSESPFIQIYSLPSPAGQPVPPPAGWGWAFSLDLTSNSILEERGAGERVVLDGETYRAVLSLGYGVSRRLTARVNVPLVAHSGGFMDSPIQEWHSFLGLSNKRRTAFEANSLDYSYEVGGLQRFALRQRERGIGDVRLETDWQLRDPAGAKPSLVLRSGVKLPTGSSDRLHGSDSTDVSLQLLSTDRDTLANWNVTLAWMVGALWLGDSEVLDDLRRDVVAIGSIGISRPVWRRLTARVQLDGHSPFYDSALRPLGSSGVQLVFGGSIELARAGRIDIAVIENLFTDTTPDVVLHLGWRGAL
jgi:hypothetical protein